MGITVYQIVYVRLNAHTLQTMTELIGSMLAVIVGNHYRTYHEVAIHEFITQTKHVLVVGNAQIGTNLILLNIFC